MNNHSNEDLLTHLAYLAKCYYNNRSNCATTDEDDYGLEKSSATPYRNKPTIPKQAASRGITAIHMAAVITGGEIVETKDQITKTRQPFGIV